ncbi:MAG: hypothetical protein U0838_14695 [Chloroflexota bacterium]
MVLWAGLGFDDVYVRTLALSGSGGWRQTPAVVDAAPIWVAGVAGIAVGLAYLALGWRSAREGERPPSR